MTKDSLGATHVTNVTYVENENDKQKKRRFRNLTKMINDAPCATHVTLALDVEHLPL